jgi:F-type H+-transporting ATPase subunit delta
MLGSLIAIRYAKAFLLKGKENGTLDELKRDIEFLNNVFDQHEALYKVLTQPTTAISQKINIIEQLFRTRLNPVTIQFINLIIKNRREYYLKAISRNFFDLYNEEKGIKYAHLTTAVELGENEQTVVKEFIKKNFAANEIDLNNHIDEDLIGGFIIQIQDQLFDASVRRQLDLIRKKFLQKKWNSH